MSEINPSPENDLSIGSNEVQGLEYVVIGVAVCFQKGEEGRLQEVWVAEPVSATDLDCLYHEVRSTSYHLLYATTYAEVVQSDRPVLPGDVFPEGVIPGENFVRRVQAATRTYRAKPQFRHIPLHECCTPTTGVFKLNHSPEPRRIINVAAEVKDADNVKQHAHTHNVL